MTERVELLEGLAVDVPDEWHVEREGDTALLLGPPGDGFVTNVFVHETRLVSREQVTDGIDELPGGVVLERCVDGRVTTVRFGYATDAESLTGIRMLVEREDRTAVLLHVTMPTRRLRSDALAVDAVLRSVVA